jgi:archaemetzincin
MDERIARPRRRLGALATASAVAVGAFAMGVALLLDGAQPGHVGRARAAPPTPAERKAIVYAQYAGTDWPKLGEPKPGEWLALVAEPGRTYDEYVRAARNLRSERRHTIYLQPLGPMDSATTAAIGQVAEFAGAFFACTVTVLPAAELPRSTYVQRRKQYDAGDLLNRMARRVPDDALAYVGLTSADLYSGRLDFVFGLASLRQRVAIVSLNRFGEPGTPEFLRRSLKSFAHETGHVFGIRHCIFYRCCMNGSNSLAESDGQPLHYCPLCHDKLRHALVFDPAQRFEKLAALYDTFGFEHDARVVRERLARLTASTKEDP